MTARRTTGPGGQLTPLTVVIAGPTRGQRMPRTSTTTPGTPSCWVEERSRRSPTTSSSGEKTVGDSSTADVLSGCPPTRGTPSKLGGTCSRAAVEKHEGGFAGTNWLREPRGGCSALIRRCSPFWKALMFLPHSRGEGSHSMVANGDSQDPAEAGPWRARPEDLSPELATFDTLGIWHAAPWRVLLLTWMTIAGATQGTDKRSPESDQALQVHHSRPPGHGAWSHWGSWSACSSTCGDGASFRTRRCIRFPEEELCRGKPRQYRVCEQDDCPAGSAPFREIQCSLYNEKPILGGQMLYEWTPFHGAPNLCDLNCLAVGHNFYYSFGRVLDGTRCSPESRDLCISGRCLRAGCDGILGSNAQADACGICGGRNESCVFVRQVFRVAFPTSGSFGYQNVTRIPAGARHIKVTEDSHSYLALMDANQQYLINGEWSIDRPGEYDAAGTKVYYARMGETHESLEAAGPTQEDLLVMVLFQEDMPSIEYQFWLLKDRFHQIQSGTSSLRQPQTREVGKDSPEDHQTFPPATPVSPYIRNIWDIARKAPQVEATPVPARTSTPTGRCRKCDMPKGKSQRIRHYCSSDFVFRAQILSKRHIGQETRYDVQVRHTYRNRFPIVHREYVWVPNTCDCPTLSEQHEYVLMARRHVNFENTLNRILLPRGSYARPWSPREDLQLREVSKHCGTW
ncbi:ADAMTS-like protein 5 isoform X1 [Varanus komodoensis]|uniref:ADAMTS-like protein 5 isoform X1 n=2 Tax=Varanus komodoensis TaxID=61221 RepID=UPI001CF7E436|nr:ADAMTS-like protein 5 isoform X1 [Varanus komodoensis]